MTRPADTRDFLVEIGTEELPPRALGRLAEAFEAGIAAGLGAADLGGPTQHTRRYYSPRRLAVMVEDVPVRQPDQTEERLGPAVVAAFDAAGKARRAAEGFAASCGTTVDKLERRQTPRGERLAFTRTVKGRATVELLPGIVSESLARLPIPRRMRWGAGDEQFVRPVHWVLMLFGTKPVPGTILGVGAGRVTYGHRFHHPQAIRIAKPADYVARLRNPGRVMLNGTGLDLEATIAGLVRAQAAKLGARALDAEPGSSLLHEVAALVEWPVALSGRFDPRFLELPREVLIATLEGQQRCFPVIDGTHRLLPHFVAVSNIVSRQPEDVAAGNERVVTPRLADAMFFWNSDRKRRLESRVPDLDRVVYQQQLGSLGDKARRLGSLARLIAARLDGDADMAARAARLAKTDLLTDMVGEFPELQGIMGCHYARRDGETAELASALREQYLPRFAGDTIAATPTGQILAIADRVDTITGIFARGTRPTGDKDPFALRRAALGLLRTVIEAKIGLDLHELIAAAAAELEVPEKQRDTLCEAVYGFFMERLRSYYQEAGVRTDVIDAVLAKAPASPLDCAKRIQAVTAFMQLPEANALAAANKRISNILRQAGITGPGQIDEKLIREPAEKTLYRSVKEMEEVLGPLLETGDYREALGRLAGLRPIVDRFFDDVMVMAEDPALRQNRLALLARLSALFLHTADLARIQSS